MLQDLVAPLYAKVLAAAARQLGPGPAYYALWPLEEPAMPWGAVFRQFYRQVIYPH